MKLVTLNLINTKEMLGFLTSLLFIHYFSVVINKSEDGVYMKTVYLFYMLFEKSLNPRLYAFTDDKEKAEIFRKTRKKELFVEKQKEVNKKKWVELNSYYSYAALSFHECITKGLDNFTKSKIKLLLTANEINSILLKSEDLIPARFKDCIINTSCFTDDINISLYKLGYFYIYKWLEVNLYNVSPMDAYFAGIDNEMTGFSGHDFEYDEYTLFMNLFGNTMRKKIEED